MKKTNKENPITTFRKNFENRSKNVMSSLKKAQTGTAVNELMKDVRPAPQDASKYFMDDPTNIMSNINIANNMRQQQMQNQSSSGAMQSRLYDQQRMADEQYKKALLNRPKPSFTDPSLPDPTKQKKGGSMYKKGGATKATKFAALAPPYNKATAADRIAGAKKNARKKK